MQAKKQSDLLCMIFFFFFKERTYDSSGFSVDGSLITESKEALSTYTCISLAMLFVKLRARVCFLLLFFFFFFKEWAESSENKNCCLRDSRKNEYTFIKVIYRIEVN